MQAHLKKRKAAIHLEPTRTPRSDPVAKRRPISKNEAAEMVRLYRSGKSTTAIARKLGRSGGTITGVLHRNSIELRQRVSLKDIDPQEASKLYESGLSLASVGKELQISEASVRRILKNQKMPSRQTTPIPKALIPQIVNSYEAGATLEELMQEYGAGNTAVANALKRGGAVMRSRGRRLKVS